MKRFWTSVCIAIVSVAAVVGAGYWVRHLIDISYNELQVNEFAMETEKLEETVKLVVLADLHEHEFGAGNKELIELATAQGADAFLLVGDMINKYSADAEVALALVEALAAEAPVYYAWGNHELEYRKLKEAAQDDLSSGAGTAGGASTIEPGAGTAGGASTIEPGAGTAGGASTIEPAAGTAGDESGRATGLEAELVAAGATVLDEVWQDVEIGGQRIRIGGLYDYAFALDGRDSCNPDRMDPEVYSFLTEYQDTELFKLMLAHNPESFVLGEASVTWDVDLVVSGHLHGGQVVLPVVGGLWGGDQRWFPEYVHGLYEKDKLHVFVTCGLGSSEKSIPRFNNVPEVAVISLVPQ